MKIPANVYLSEEQLVELQQEHLIGWVQYVELHSEEMKNDYREYCMVNHLDRKAEQSAILFLLHIEHLL